MLPVSFSDNFVSSWTKQYQETGTCRFSLIQESMQIEAMKQCPTDAQGDLMSLSKYIYFK